MSTVDSHLTVHYGSAMSHVAIRADGRWRAQIAAAVPTAPAISVHGSVAFCQVSPSGGSRVLVLDRACVVASTPPAGERSRDAHLDERLPRWSPDGVMLAMVSSDEGIASIRVVDAVRGTAIGTRQGDVPLATTYDVPIAGRWRAEEMTWSGPDELVLLVAPLDSDTSVGSGSVRNEVSGAVRVRRADSGRRRLMTVRPSDGLTALLETGPATVWEFALAPGRGFVAVTSDDPTESGWYGSRLSLLPSATSPVRSQDRGERESVLYEPGWQIARPAVSPDGRRVAIVEGWSSDRGHVAGDGRIVDLDDGSSIGWSLDGIDAVTYDWVDDLHLCFSGWIGERSVHGVVDDRGNITSVAVDANDDVHREMAISPVGGRDVAAAIRHRGGAIPALVTSRDGGAFRPVSVSAAGAAASETAGRTDMDTRIGMRVEELEWTAADGSIIRGLLITRDDLRASDCQPVLVVHGGPANLWTRAGSAGTTALACAGYAVIAPNPRGSVGRGQRYARANLGDPAGDELDDVLGGATLCRREGLVLDRRPGIVGGSYGGYLTSAAAVLRDEVAAAVVMFGHPDLISARFASNNPAFYDLLLGGPPVGELLDVYAERSPVLHAHPGVVPTLILHGEADRCTPVGQADELFRALLDQGVETELVTYPGQGHGLRSPDCQIDAWTRTIEWFDRHLGRQLDRQLDRQLVEDLDTGSVTRVREGSGR